FKLLSSKSNHSHEGTYAEVCFHYIHQNPLKAGLVHKLEEWNFSSFKEYIRQNHEINSIASNTFCNKDLALTLLNIKPDNLYKISYDAIKPELLDKIF